MLKVDIASKPFLTSAVLIKFLFFQRCVTGSNQAWFDWFGTPLDYTAWFRAIHDNDHILVKSFLEVPGMDVNTVDENGQTALTIADNLAPTL